MYLPERFSESRPEELHRLIRENPLGMLVTNSLGALEANHLPFMLSAQGPCGALFAHIARANPLWKEVSNGDRVLVIFRGAQGYVSPNWYPSKHETHRHVPTWNYEVVHAHGRIQFHDDPKFVRGLVARLTRKQEASEPHPWKMSDAPAEYLAEQLKEVIGIEIELTRLEGKRKLSQNRDARDFEGTVRSLEERGQSVLASAMKNVYR